MFSSPTVPTQHTNKRRGQPKPPTFRDNLVPPFMAGTSTKFNSSQASNGGNITPSKQVTNLFNLKSSALNKEKENQKTSHSVASKFGNSSSMMSPNQNAGRQSQSPGSTNKCSPASKQAKLLNSAQTAKGVTKSSSSKIEMFSKNNFSFIELMRAQKQARIEQKRQERLAAAKAFVGGLTNMNSAASSVISSSMCSKAGSNVSTPRLTPLRLIERNRASDKTDIDKLENKILALEQSIANAKQAQTETHALDKLEQSLGMDYHGLDQSLDQSKQLDDLNLADEDDQQLLINTENFELLMNEYLMDESKLEDFEEPSGLGLSNSTSKAKKTPSSKSQKSVTQNEQEDIKPVNSFFTGDLAPISGRNSVTSQPRKNKLEQINLQDQNTQHFQFQFQEEIQQNEKEEDNPSNLGFQSSQSGAPENKILIDDQLGACFLALETFCNQDSVLNQVDYKTAWQLAQHLQAVRKCIPESALIMPQATLIDQARIANALNTSHETGTSTVLIEEPNLLNEKASKKREPVMTRSYRKMVKITGSDISKKKKASSSKMKMMQKMKSKEYSSPMKNQIVKQPQQQQSLLHGNLSGKKRCRSVVDADSSMEMERVKKPKDKRMAKRRRF